MPKKKREGHATLASKSELDVMNQLFEETLELAEEEGAVDSAADFVSYIKEMLPPEVLASICEIAGDSEATFLEDIFDERFAKCNLEVKMEEDVHEDVVTDLECQLCERVIKTTRHHVYPRETHDWMGKKGIDRIALGTTIPLCRMCHSAIHRFFTNKELAEKYHSLDSLLEDERVYRFAKWASTQQGRGNLRTK